MKEHGALCFPPSFPPGYDNMLDYYVFCYCTRLKKVVSRHDTHIRYVQELIQDLKKEGAKNENS